MAHPFGAIWLLDAQASMGMFFDILLRGLAISPEEAAALFLDSLAWHYETGNSLYYSYFDGRRAVFHLFSDMGQPGRFDENIEVDPRSRAYWTGWALCYYQWYTNHRFKDILACRSLTDILGFYDFLHSRPLSQFVAFMEQAYLASSTIVKLPYQLIDSEYRDRNVIFGRFRPKKGLYTMADVDARLLQNAWESFAVPHDISYLLNCLMGIEKEEEPEQMKSYWTSGGGDIEVYCKTAYPYGTYKKLQKALDELDGLLADKDAWRKKLVEDKFQRNLFTAYIDYDESIIWDYDGKRKAQLLVEQSRAFRRIAGTVSSQLKELFTHAGKRTRLVMYGDPSCFSI